MMFRFIFGTEDFSMVSTPRDTLEEMYAELYGAVAMGVPVQRIEHQDSGEWSLFNGADNVIPLIIKEEKNA